MCANAVISRMPDSFNAGKMSKASQKQRCASDVREASETNEYLCCDLNPLHNQEIVNITLMNGMHFMRAVSVHVCIIVRVCVKNVRMYMMSAFAIRVIRSAPPPPLRTISFESKHTRTQFMP